MYKEFLRKKEQTLDVLDRLKVVVLRWRNVSISLTLQGIEIDITKLDAADQNNLITTAAQTISPLEFEEFVILLRSTSND